MRTDSRELQERKERRAAEVADALTGAIVRTLRTPDGRQLWIWIRDVLCLADSRAPAGVVLDRFEGRRDVAYDMDKALAQHPEVAIQISADRAAFRADEVRFKASLARGEDHGPEAALPAQKEE